MKYWPSAQYVQATVNVPIARVNVGGTQRLLAAAASANAGFCLISSMSAYAGTRQLYGRAKLACERDVLGRGSDRDGALRWHIIRLCAG